MVSLGIFASVSSLYGAPRPTHRASKYCMMNAANINLVAFSHYLESMAGQLVALFIIAIAAGEAAVGLAIIIVVFRGKISTNVDEMNLLKW